MSKEKPKLTTGLGHNLNAACGQREVGRVVVTGGEPAGYCILPSGMCHSNNQNDSCQRWPT